MRARAALPCPLHTADCMSFVRTHLRGEARPCCLRPAVCACALRHRGRRGGVPFASSRLPAHIHTPSCSALPPPPPAYLHTYPCAGSERKAFNSDVRALVESRYGRQPFDLQLETKLYVLEKVRAEGHMRRMECATDAPRLAVRSTPSSHAVLTCRAGPPSLAPPSPAAAAAQDAQGAVDPQRPVIKPVHEQSLFGV